MVNNALIITPTYNEKDTISNLLSEILGIYPSADILVVDDNSPDGTGEIVERLAKKDNRITCLHRSYKDGIGPAYIAGFKEALKREYSYILQMDADFSHDPKYIPGVFSLAKEYDLVLGSRYIQGGGTRNWGIIRRLISRLGSLYAKLILGLQINDLTGGFKCFNRKVLESIELDDVKSRGYVFQIEMTYRAWRKGFKIKEYPIIFTDRRVGQTKMSRSIFFEAFINVWRLRLRKWN
jgi:dolichol-phosphate mannosyltransferase